MCKFMKSGSPSAIFGYIHYFDKYFDYFDWPNYKLNENMCSMNIEKWCNSFKFYIHFEPFYVHLTLNWNLHILFEI